MTHLHELPKQHRRRKQVTITKKHDYMPTSQLNNRNSTIASQGLLAVAAVSLFALPATAQPPHSGTITDNALMLAGDWVPEDPHQIDYEKLPRVEAEHVIISDVRDHAGTRVHQHAYLAHHDGRFWAMWSDGPGGPRAGVTPEQHRNIVPAHDMPGTRNSFSTSEDGLHWSKPADLTGPPRKKGFGWIARGFWERDGDLLALASHFDAPGYEGLGLSLEAFRWTGTEWVPHGKVLDDSMNNFPPKRLPSGEWMMTRRDHRRQVSVMIGGTKAFNDWHINPLASYDGNGRPEEPYWYILPDGKTIAGLIRDNGRSKFLLRTFSRDNGKTWSKMHRTNFPDATSKFFVHRTSRGYYVMVSNSNPRKRDPLTLAISKDGLVFTKLFWLIGGRHVDYPHIIEHDGHLLIAFSGAKQTMEVMKVSLDELERLEMPESVELDQHLPPIKQTPQQRPSHWIDLGDEGKTLYAVADLVVPELGQRTSFSLATASGAERVIVGIDEKGRLTAQLYKETVTGLTLEPGSRHSLLIRLHSHSEKPDELFVGLGASGQIPAEPENWTLSNTKGSSAANLSRVVLQSDADDSAGFTNVRIASTREALANEMSLPGKASPRESSGTRRAPATTVSVGSIDRVDAPPNIVLIVIDDLGYGDLGCYGSKVHQTPNIDALADAGLRLTDFHTNAPVCSPTRAALMTGQYQQRSGIESAIGFVTDEGVSMEKVTIAELLRKRGYTSGIIGKWHLGWVGAYGPNDQGFDISYCSNNSPDYHSHVSRNGKVDWYKNHELHKENGYLTDLVTRHSNTFIEQNREKPFFLFVSHLALHFPFQGPSDPPFRTEGKLWHGKERIRGKMQPDSKYGPLPPEQYQRAYRDMLEAVDASVGSIVATLDRLELRKNTLIVITSDNGAYSWVGSNGIYRGQKGDLFEGGHRVPAVFNWPGHISEGVVDDSTTMTMDLAPTFAALAGPEESDSKHFDGVDLSKLLLGKAPVPVRTLFWRFNNSYTSTHARSVREGKWKYVLEKDIPYLFDLEKDPAEEQNLASDYPDRVRDMDDAFLAWEKKVAQGGSAQ